MTHCFFKAIVYGQWTFHVDIKKLTPGFVTAKVQLKTLSPEIVANSQGQPFQISPNRSVQLFEKSVSVEKRKCPEEMTIVIELSIRSLGKD
jgi:hypothetical protein